MIFSIQYYIFNHFQKKSPRSQGTALYYVVTRLFHIEPPSGRRQGQAVLGRQQPGQAAAQAEVVQGRPGQPIGLQATHVNAGHHRDRGVEPGKYLYICGEVDRSINVWDWISYFCQMSENLNSFELNKTQGSVSKISSWYSN